MSILRLISRPSKSGDREDRQRPGNLLWEFDDSAVRLASLVKHAKHGKHDGGYRRLLTSMKGVKMTSAATCASKNDGGVRLGERVKMEDAVHRLRDT